MKTALITLLTGAVFGKFRGARIEDLIHKINLPETAKIVDAVKPHAEHIKQLVTEEAHKAESHFKHARADYDQK